MDPGKLGDIIAGDGGAAGVAGAEIEDCVVVLDFLFRVEMDSDTSKQEPHYLNDYELASRLSYFLWSSMPDEALLAQAKND